MLRSTWLGLFGLCVLLLRAQSLPFADEFAPTWQRACQYTLEVAQTMPDSLYGYRPVDSVFSFGEHLLHLEGNLYGLCSRYVQGLPRRRPMPGADATDKSAVLARLRAAMAYVDSTLAATPDSALAQVATGFWSPGTRRRGIFWLMRDHMTHHRGQLIVYLRLNGLAPPRYQGW